MFHISFDERMKDSMIRVMSFNVRHNGGGNDDNSWLLRKQLTVKRIRHFDPDLLGIQECMDGEQAEYCKIQFPDYGIFAVQRGNSEKPDAVMVPILYRRSRFERLDSGYFWLGESPNEPGITSWDDHFTPIVMWIKLRDRQAPAQTITFLNTHFAYVPMATTLSAKVLREQIGLLNFGTPMIITGDFNAEKSSLTYRTLMGNGKPGIFKDTFRAVNTDSADAGTYHDFGRRDPTIATNWILATEHFSTTESGIDRY